MRVALVIGTRPQIIKSAPIVHAAKGFPEVELLIVHTGQHYDYAMSREFFNELALPDPVVNLGVGSGSHGWQTGQMLMGLEKAFTELKPDVVLVPGDTNSTLAGALAAVKMHIPVAHVESGARSFDRRMPEEINRVIVDHVSDLLFVVSQNCVNNLAREGIPSEKIRLLGDTMYESVQNHMKDIEAEKTAESLGLEKGKYGVLTLHRAENTDDGDRLRSIMGAIGELGFSVVFPCHPRTRERLEKLGLLEGLGEAVRMVEPLPYFRILSLVRDAWVVLTDSGGLQKEACWLGTPCVTLRDSTEWVETVEVGSNVLVGSDACRIVEAVRGLNSRPGRPAFTVLSEPGVSRGILEGLIACLS
ncbi:MAG: UDP-N-acetylglucosamine 2-epimerase (non-hydrolyzing) [Candidatus Bathyarchaeia archaeon]